MISKHQNGGPEESDWRQMTVWLVAISVNALTEEHYESRN